jgi:TolB-like protein
MASMWEELKRRHVVKVGLAYVAVGWLLIEIASTLLLIFKAPPWVLPTLTSLIILGFPLALVLSWIFDLTPRGLERTRSDVQSDGASEGITNVSERTLGLAIIGGLVLVLGIIVVDTYVLVDTPDDVSNTRDVLPNSVAVLQFENLSGDSDDAHFSAGLHEAILSKLAKLRDLSVISRTSVLRYAGSDLSIPEIARELNVGTVMEGSVQYANDRVRIFVNLIDAATDEHLWSETYDREFSDIFAIESDIATNVTRALQVELVLAEQEDVKRAPTPSSEAYRLYLSATQQGHQSDEVRLELLGRAIEAAPDFALPYVERASIYIQQQRTPGTTASLQDRRAEPEALAIEDLDKALVIDPTLGWAYAWLGMLHRYNHAYPVASQSGAS